jgi:hypothetical protein
MISTCVKAVASPSINARAGRLDAAQQRAVHGGLQKSSGILGKVRRGGDNPGQRPEAGGVADAAPKRRPRLQVLLPASIGTCSRVRRRADRTAPSASAVGAAIGSMAAARLLTGACISSTSRIGTWALPSPRPPRPPCMDGSAVSRTTNRHDRGLRCIRTCCQLQLAVGGFGTRG